MRKKVKINNSFAQDANFNNVYMTLKQATRYCKKYKRTLEKQFINNYKFEHFDMIERDNYFTCSIA
tara:strand:+ start:908 stop:1105 length:198 start_codon:yes stop_codon:yes gene_type:complete